MAVSKGIYRELPKSTEVARVLPTDIEKKLEAEQLERLQDELLERSLKVVDLSVQFAEIDPDDEGPPDKWVEQFGQEEANKRFRIAKAAWQGAKNAPIGIKVAASVAVGIMRARAQRDVGPRTLNVAVVQVTGPIPSFPTQVIEPGR